MCPTRIKGTIYTRWAIADRMLSLPTVIQLALFQLYDFLVVSDDTVELVDPPQEDVLGQEEVSF